MTIDLNSFAKTAAAGWADINCKIDFKMTATKLAENNNFSCCDRFNCGNNVLNGLSKK